MFPAAGFANLPYTPAWLLALLPPIHPHSLCAAASGPESPKASSKAQIATVYPAARKPSILSTDAQGDSKRQKNVLCLTGLTFLFLRTETTLRAARTTPGRPGFQSAARGSGPLGKMSWPEYIPRK